MALVLVGDGPLKEHLEDVTTRMALQKKVIFTGWVKNPLDFMHDFDILVIPSLYEGCPSVILEAFSLNVPVFGSKAGGIPELLGHDELMFRAMNQDDLASKLKMFLTSDENHAHVKRITMDRKKVFYIRSYFSSRATISAIARKNMIGKLSVKALKILFVLGLPNPFPSAAWTRIGFFAEDWSRKGHAVEVLGIFSYEAFHKRGVKKMGNINIFNLIFNMGLTHPLIFILNAVISFAVSTLILISRRPNVAIVSVPSGDVGMGALMACRLTRTKCIVDYRDEWEDYAINLNNSKNGKSFYLVKKLASSLYLKRLVVAVTPKYLEALKQRGLTNVKLVPNGADIKTFKPLTNKRKSLFLIFYSGHVGSYYRLDVAVKAIKKLEEKGIRNIKLVIAGDGEVEKLLGLAAELGISSNIEYKGVINDKLKLSRLISEADAGLIPYDNNPLWKNSLPAKFFEYCACGLPAIATVHENSILAKLIRECEIGLTVPPMDEEKLAEAIYRIYENESFREAAGKRARLLIEEKFDRNKIAKEFLNLIKALNQG